MCRCSAAAQHTFFTDGARELFDCAGQGRIDVFFLSGGQIDGEGNINLVSVGDYDQPKARFPGSFGSAYLYYVVPKVILFRVEHSRRTLVPKVDFISAPGGSADNVFRPGGPIALVTNRCLFDFDRERRRFRLASVHPGHSVDEVIENTGFDFDRPADVPVTPAPSAETLHLMRGIVAPMLAEVYPQFAEKRFRYQKPGQSCVVKHCYNFHDFRELARRRLPGPIFNYIDGAADDETTYRRNTRASRGMRSLCASVLAGVEQVDLSLTVHRSNIGGAILLLADRVAPTVSPPGRTRRSSAPLKNSEPCSAFRRWVQSAWKTSPRNFSFRKSISSISTKTAA